MINPHWRAGHSTRIQRPGTLAGLQGALTVSGAMTMRLAVRGLPRIENIIELEAKDSWTAVNHPVLDSAAIHIKYASRAFSLMSRPCHMKISVGSLAHVLDRRQPALSPQGFARVGDMTPSKLNFNITGETAHHRASTKATGSTIFQSFRGIYT